MLLLLTRYSQPFQPFRQRISPRRFRRSPAPMTSVHLAGKTALVGRLLAAKEATGKTFTQIAKEVGLTNAYTAQLFYNQAHLKPGTVDKLKTAVPGISEDDLKTIQKIPFRSFDEQIKQEPHIYRMTEAVLHYGEAIKAIMNEECGDGIMSAIDMFASIDFVDGKTGEKRVVISLCGKFLPHIEQIADNNTAPLPPPYVKK